MNNNFLIGLTAFLNKDKSKTQIQSDAKQLGDANIKVPLVGTLDKAKTKVQLRQDLASMKGTINLTGKVNQKSIVSSVQQATQQAQRAVGKNPIQLNFNLKKDKLINDLRILGQQNSKMFKNADISAKYNSLLNNAKLATSGKELQNLRLQLSAMRSEIKATNLSGMTLGDTFKKTFRRATELFTGTAGVMLISKQLKEAWTQAIELDTAFTDLVKVQDELSRSDYADYLDRCNKKAQELATTQKSLIEGVTEFSRSGYNLTESNALAEKSTILSNVGEMSAEDSSKALISGIQAYKDIDGYTSSIDKATQLIDKYNELGNRASITSAELAKGVETVGSVFADANTNVNEFLSMLSAGNRQYQDANSLALGLRTSALRIRAAKVDLKNSGEDTDGVKSVLDNQKAIKKLTNVDILEKDKKTVRSIYDIFLDISKVYQQMNDTDQSALLKIIAGTHRASAVSAVLNNMSEAQKLYKISLNSTGSAQKEYDKYMQSSQASLNKFKASVTETYQSIITGNTAKTILDIGNAAVKLANNLGLVSSTLRGFLAIGVVKVLTTITTAFKTSAIQASNFGTALNTVKNMSSMTRGTTEYTNALNLLKTVSAGLTETQLKQVLANEALCTSDKVRILQATGLSKSQANAKLAQMGLTQATRAQTAANAGATASTFSLSAAVKGFGASLKAAFMSNPIGITIMAISMAVGAISSAVSSANEEVEEARQKAKDAADTASTLSDELSELSGKYLSLSESVKTNASSKEEFMNVQDELLKKLGLEGESVDKLISKYGSLDEAVKNATVDKLKEKETDLIEGVKAAEEELKSVGKDYKGFFGLNDRNIISSSGSDALKAFKVLNKAGSVEDGSVGTNGGVLTLTGDDKTVDGILENYKKLQEAIKTLQNSSEFSNEDLKNNPVFSQIYNRAQEMKEFVEGYNNSISKLNKNVAQQQTLKILKGKNLPNSEKEFNTFRDNLIKTAQSSKEFIGSQKDIKTAINSYLSSIPELSKYYNNLSVSVQNANKIIKKSSLAAFDSAWSSLKDSEQKKFTNLVNSGKLTAESFNQLGDSAETLKQTGLSVESLCDNIRALVANEQKLRNMSTAFKKVGTTYKDFKKNGFVSSSSLNSMPDAFKNLKGYSQFSKTAGNKKSSKSDIQDAFNDIVAEYLNTYHVLSGLTDKTKDKIITALRDAGITNANDLIKQYERVHKSNIKLLNESEKNYIKYLNSKGTNNEITNKKINEMNANLINALGKQYKTDYNNWVKLIQDKIKAYNKFVNAYNKSSIQGQTAYESEKSENNQAPVSDNKGIKSGVDSILKNPQAAVEAHDIKQSKTEYNKKKKQAEQAKKKLQLKLDKVDVNYDLDYEPTSASGTGSNSKKSKSSDTIDWIARKLTVLQSVIDKTSGKLQNLFSIKGKNNNIDKQIAEHDTLIKADNKAYKAYMKKANKVKLSKKLKEKVRNGDYDIVKYDSKTADAIHKYQDYIDKAKEAKNSVQDNIASIVELNKQKLDNVTSYYDALISKIDATTSKLEAQISLQKSVNSVYGKGETGSADTYDKLISNTSSDITQYKSEKKTYDSTRKSARNKLKKELKKNGVSKSERKAALVQFDSETKAQIENFNTSIFNAESKLYEYAQSLASLPWDKASAKVDKLSSSYDVLNAKLANGTSVTDKNKILNQMNDNLDSQLSQKKSALTNDNKNIKDTAKWLNKNTKTKVKSGKLISLEDLNAIKKKYGNNSKQYAKAIEYNVYVDKRDTDKLDYDKSVEENKSNKAENAKTKFTNIQNDYQRKLDTISNSADSLNNQMSILEAKGYKITANYYQQLANNSQKTINEATKEKEALQASLNESLVNGTIQKGTDAYYEMVDAINTVTKSIDEAALSQTQYLQKVRETNREIEKSARDAISNLNSEAEFYKDILAYEELYDDNGNLNDAGKATMQLSMVEMSDYIALNNKFKQSIADLDQQYTYGKMGFDEYYTQKQTLLSEQREAIKGYYSECDAIKTLIENGYNAQKEALSDLISKYTEALDAEKNLHDYEKNIKEKTENIDSIKKRIAALQGNDTEEARQKIQKLTIDLKSAQEDLEETQYEQYLSDQKDILDDLQNDYQTFVEEQLKNVQDLINALITDANTNTGAVVDKLDKIAKLWGTDFENNKLKESLETASFGSVTNQDANAVKVSEKVYDKFKDDLSTSKVIKLGDPPVLPTDNSEDPDTNSHKKKEQEEETAKTSDQSSNLDYTEIAKVDVKNKDDEKAKNKTQSGAIVNPEAYKSDKEKEKESFKKIINNLIGSSDDTNKPLRKVKKGETSKSALNKKLSADYGVVVKSGAGNHGQKYIDMFAKAVGLVGSGGGYGENDEVYQKLKKDYPHLGFSTGGVVGQLNKVATDNGDDAWITVKSKERVLTARQNNLWEKWTKNLPELMNVVDYLPDISEYMPKIPDMTNNIKAQNTGNSVNVGDISYTMEFPNVTDPASMKEAIKQDTSLQNMLRDITIGQMKKGNKLGMMKY